jgi:hypothetical protein
MANSTSKRPGRVENLKTKTSEEARELGRRGGIKSGIAKREKKLVSQVYADFLRDTFKVALESGELKEMDGAEYLAETVKRVLARADGASVSMAKELREATEGSRFALTGGDGEKLFPDRIEFVVVTPDENTDT